MKVDLRKTKSTLDLNKLQYNTTTKCVKRIGQLEFTLDMFVSRWFVTFMNHK